MSDWLPEEVEAWRGDPFGRVVDSEGRSIRIETDGRGGLVEIPEDTPPTGFLGMTWRERAQPVPRIETPEQDQPLSVEDRLQAVLDEIERLGSATNRELNDRLGYGLNMLAGSTTALTKLGCLERRKLSGTGATAPWTFRATGQPIPERATPENDLAGRRYREALIAHLRVHSRVTVAEAAAAMGCPTKRARLHLRALLEEGLVAQVHSGRALEFVSLIEQQLAS